MKLCNMKLGVSKLGCIYGEVEPKSGGVVLDVTTFPDGTYFHVSNGLWYGYIDRDESGKRMIYTGIVGHDLLYQKYISAPPPERCINIVEVNEDSYEVAVDRLFIDYGKHRKMFDPRTVTIEELQVSAKEAKIERNGENRFRIMHLIGSTKQENKHLFDEAEAYYTNKGYVVFKPVFYGLKSDDERLGMLTDMCTMKLNICDTVCVVTEHIGESTRKRIEQAKNLGKEVIYFQKRYE